MNGLWLLDQSTLDSIESMIDSNQHTPSKAELEEFNASYALDENGRPSIMQVAGDNAIINISGVMTDKPDYFLKWFGSGNTIYSDIRTSLAIAENDSSVSEIIVKMNSGGGQATPEWLATLEAFENTTKPVRVEVGFIAASAAYGIAAKADTIVAQNKLTHIGSIGVVQQVRKKNQGGTVEITSSNAPSKRPDPETESGMAEIQGRIDDIEKVFIDNVASGRGVSAQTVKNDFGRGGVMLADKALSVGMIDEIAGGSAAVEDNSSTVTTNQATSATSGEQTEVDRMDLATLKAQHPDVYAAAVAEGENLGKTQEGKRVKALCILGDGSGNTEFAMACIKDGSDSMDPVVQATFMSSKMNKTDQGSRADAEDDASDALDGADTSTPDAKDMEDQIADALAEDLGLTEDV